MGDLVCSEEGTPSEDTTPCPNAEYGELILCKLPDYCEHQQKPFDPNTVVECETHYCRNCVKGDKDTTPEDCEYRKQMGWSYEGEPHSE